MLDLSLHSRITEKMSRFSKENKSNKDRKTSLKIGSLVDLETTRRKCSKEFSNSTEMQQYYSQKTETQAEQKNSSRLVKASLTKINYISLFLMLEKKDLGATSASNLRKMKFIQSLKMDKTNINTLKIILNLKK